MGPIHILIGFLFEGNLRNIASAVVSIVLELGLCVVFFYKSKYDDKRITLKEFIRPAIIGFPIHFIVSLSKRKLNQIQTNNKQTKGGVMNKKPTHFHIFKLVGVVGVITAVIGIALAISGFGDFETNNFMIGGFLTTFGLFAGISCTVAGFQPEIAKTSIRTNKYIQDENKEDLTDIANTAAKIHANAVTTISHAAAKGFTQENTVFCKECGAKIDADSKFCRHCGTKQTF
jgi:hypothetical protein